ncbi:protein STRICTOSIDINE SYNTHASE-LIKE 11-like [Coffea eugenioides]|uniref:protein STRICTOSIDINE SYNTHASE-LIKE 11-like n=1 Tax=Coffea eugenioides TaxID=49369 RepID=UPI000F60AC19|nr:protein STRICTOSIDINE SYNTHASE-LIKE 11-like [Coffea eugenioides]
MLSILVILLLLRHIHAIDPYQKFAQINLPPGGPIGPESVALDRFNQGPYIGVSDGRILKYQGPTTGFVDFAFVAPNRNKQLCDGATDPDLGPTCGRILGASFDPFSGQLYMVDTFFGLAVVGPNGGKATIIANSANGVKFNFLNGCDVSPITREVIFTDGSQTFDIRDVIRGNFTPDSSGRLIKYIPRTNEVKVVSDGLSVPAGPAFSHDGSFVLFSEFSNKRIIKYRLIEDTTEVFLNLTANPIKIKRAPTYGEYWVAANNIIVSQPRSVTPFGYKFNLLKQILITKNLQAQYNNTQVNVLQEYNVNGGTLYIGSRVAPYVGVFNKW